MADVLFYHLTEKTLEQALPQLLERTLANGWRAVVQSGDEERLEGLDNHLWTYREDSFLPHGREGDGAAHPIWLTAGEDDPNGAQVRFLVQGATPPEIHTHQRVAYLFDGLDNDAVATARERWKAEKAAGHVLTYWQQEGGRWVKKAEA